MISYQLESFGKPLAEVLRETPMPQGTEVIVRVGSCGVCHSDVHLHDGYFDLGEGNKLDMTCPGAMPSGYQQLSSTYLAGTASKGCRHDGNETPTASGFGRRCRSRRYSCSSTKSQCLASGSDQIDAIARRGRRDAAVAA